MKRVKPSQEQRRYIRLSTVFPVQFYFIDEQGKKSSPYIQGFTHDIAEGGIRIIVNDLWEGLGDRCAAGRKIFLEISFLLSNKSIQGDGEIRWAHLDECAGRQRCHLGVEFETVPRAQSAFLYRYARIKKAVPYTTIFVLALVSASAGYFHLQQRRAYVARAQILREYQNLLAHESVYRENYLKKAKEVTGLQKEHFQLTQRLDSALVQLELVKKELIDAVQQSQDKSEIEQKKITALQEEIAVLKTRLSQVSSNLARKEVAAQQLSQILDEKTRRSQSFEQKMIQDMFLWIKDRQDLRSGLVLSYEGDERLKKVAFTYDQALAVIVFLSFDQPDRAEKILEFYLAEVTAGRPIYNAYYTNEGVWEYTRHAGVNAWIGLAALQYVRATNNMRYLSLCHSVKEYLLSLMDAEGGIRGGQDISWYSTEHNLDAYAFFKLYAQVTGDARYEKTAAKILSWLDTYAYTDNSIPVQRGKGDATIATDTYAWSIAAVGPEVLQKFGMMPDEILAYAKDHCAVTVRIMRNEKEITVEGFDFSRSRNAPRGGVISCEWTAQMIVSYAVMAAYYRDKELDKYSRYKDLFLFYSHELQKMVFLSPSPYGKVYPVLPYASHPSADTGHGWRTPHSDRVASLAATAYYLLGYKQINPLTGQIHALL